jgi:hypothetical protein
VTGTNVPLGDMCVVIMRGEVFVGELIGSKIQENNLFNNF